MKKKLVVDVDSIRKHNLKTSDPGKKLCEACGRPFDQFNNHHYCVRLGGNLPPILWSYVREIA